jgi:hypothetical protein
LDHKGHRVFRAFKETQAHKASALPYEVMWLHLPTCHQQVMLVMDTLLTQLATYGFGTVHSAVGATLVLLLVQKAHKAHKAYRATQAHKAVKVSREILDRKAHKAYKATLEHKDHKVYRAYRATLEQLGHKEYKATLAQLAHKDHRVYKAM